MEQFLRYFIDIKPFFQNFWSILMSLLSFFGDLLILHRFASSGECWILQCFMARSRSLMYIRESNGTKTDP